MYLAAATARREAIRCAEGNSEVGWREGGGWLKVPLASVGSRPGCPVNLNEALDKILVPGHHPRIGGQVNFCLNIYKNYLDLKMNIGCLQKIFFLLYF